MNDQSNIERIVMRRVHLMRILGLIISTAVLALLTLILALWGIGREVWVARIFENMPHSGDFAAVGRFYLDAFGHTRLVVQVLTLLSLAACIYLARKTARALISFFTPPHV
ncbi:MAG: hypothetical protein WC638_01840 [Candidatus Paceibacterota bacterium]|jgi:hypothetical protein